MPRALRIILRIFSNNAIAMWPPSNGSSGTRLIAPSTKFSWARKNQNAMKYPCSNASPPMIDAPTTLIGVSGSRVPPPMECTSAPTLVGILASDLPSSTARSPVNATVPGIAVSGLYCAYRTGPNSAAAIPIAPTVDGTPAVSVVQRWVLVTSMTVENCFVVAPSVLFMTNCVGPVSVRTAATISLGLCTSVSPTLTMMSPALMPAAAAGPVPVQWPIWPLLTSGATQEVSLTYAADCGCRFGSPQV